MADIINRMSLAEYRLAKAKEATPKKHKYNAKPTEVDGIRFDSKAEASQYMDLKIQERLGAIQSLELQPSFPLIVNGVKIGTYRADFRYIVTKTGETVVRDTKGMKTPVYTMKKKLVKALYGIDILET